MIVTIHQPDFMPWLGFFERWRASDLYVILDDVQFLRRGWHHRDRIKTVSGPAWLTVPVLKKGAFDQEIREVRLEKGPWRRKHLATIRAAYARAPNFSGVFPLLEEVYGRGHDRLVELNQDLLQLFAKLLEIATPVALASDSRIEADGTIRLVRLCVAHGANVYLTGTGSRAYLDEELFRAQGVRVEWQRFTQPSYSQLYGEFVPNLSALDFLMMDTRPRNSLGSS